MILIGATINGEFELNKVKCRINMYDPEAEL